MCQNVYKLAMGRMDGKAQREFSLRLLAARAKKRKLLWERDGGKCHFCLQPTVLPVQGLDKQYSGKMATLDHIIPQSEGGTDKLTNLVLACANCNQNRGTIDYYEFFRIMATPNGWFEYKRKRQSETSKAKNEAKQKAADERLMAEAKARVIRDANRRLGMFRHVESHLKKWIAEERTMPVDELAQREWALDQMSRQGTINNQCGPNGLKLLHGWISQANFAGGYRKKCIDLVAA